MRDNQVKLAQEQGFARAGARFRLLLLALRHTKQCQADSSQRGLPCPFAVMMLQEKVLALALQYFQAPPTWYGRWTKAEARSAGRGLRVEIPKPNVSCVIDWQGQRLQPGNGYKSACRSAACCDP